MTTKCTYVPLVMQVSLVFKTSSSYNNIISPFYFQGLKRSEQHTLLELFRTKMVHNTASPGSLTENTSNVSDSSRIKRLEKLIKKQF